MLRLFKILLPLMIIVAAVFVARGLIAQRPALKTESDAPRYPLVETLTVEPGDVPLTLHSEGTVQSRHRLQLTSDVSGRVTWVSPDFLVGQAVEAEQPLLRIDETDYKLALAQAMLDLRDAELNLADTRSRFSTRSQHPQLQRAHAQVEAAQAQLAKARKDLANTEIRSPFRALVNSKNVAPGQFVTATTALGELLDVAVVEIALPVSAAELRLLQDGRVHPVTLSAEIGNRTLQWRAEITRLHQQIDPQTRVAYAVAEVADPYHLNRKHLNREHLNREHLNSEAADTPPLRIGQFVHAEIGGIAVAAAVRLPSAALFEDRYVFTVDANDVLRSREVDVLRYEPDSVVISAGIRARERIVLSRLDLMTDGMPVRTAPKHPEAAPAP